jgi:hypothetical protein
MNPMGDQQSQPDHLSYLASGGEMAALLRSVD